MAGSETFLEECLILILFGFLILALLMHISLPNMMALLSTPEEDRRVDSTAYLDSRHPFRGNPNPFRDDSPEMPWKSQYDLSTFIVKCFKTFFYSIYKSEANSKLLERRAGSRQAQNDQIYLILMGICLLFLYLIVVISFLYSQRLVILDELERDAIVNDNRDINSEDDDDSDDSYNYDGYDDLDQFFDNNFLRDNLLFPDDDADNDNDPGEFNGVHHDNDGDNDKTPVATQQQPLSEYRYQLTDDDSDYVVEGVLQLDELIGSDVIEALNGRFGSVHGLGIRDSTIDSMFMNDIPGLPPTWEDVNGSVFRPLRDFEDGERVLVVF